MIREAIKFVEQDLNNFINIKQGTPFFPPLVVASSLRSQDGSLATQQDKALAISLLSIQEEKVTGSGSSHRHLSLEKNPDRMRRRPMQMERLLFSGQPAPS